MLLYILTLIYNILLILLIQIIFVLINITLASNKLFTQTKIAFGKRVESTSGILIYLSKNILVMRGKINMKAIYTITLCCS